MLMNMCFNHSLFSQVECFVIGNYVASVIFPLASGVLKKPKNLSVQSGGGGGAGGAPEAARLGVRASQQLVHLPERQHEEPDPQSLRTPPQQRPRPTGARITLIALSGTLYLPWLC